MGLVCDFLPGLCLSRQTHRPSMERLQIIAAQLAGLSHWLHSRGFFAGYLTPSKLFLDDFEAPRLSLCWPGDIVVGAKRRGDSIRYCAPELMAGAACTSQSDVYSLGMLFYYLFTGIPPFSEHDLEALREKQLVAYPPRPRHPARCRHPAGCPRF